MYVPREFPNICQLCGESFNSRMRVAKYCSQRCVTRAWRLRQEEKAAPLERASTTRRKRSESSPIVQNDKEYLTIAQASALIGISDRTLHRLMSSNAFPFKKIGARTIILQSDLKFFLENL